MKDSEQGQPAKKRKPPIKELDEILKDAGQEALRSAHGTGDLEKLSKGADAAKALAEAREVNLGLGWLPRWAKLLASWATALTLVVAFATLYFQSRQFHKSEEDTQWREAMKAVSFDNPSQALVAAIWMESFFDSQSESHRRLSRHVAATLLSKVENVAGFDDVLTDLVAHTDEKNQTDIIDVAQKVNTFQWQRYGPAPEDPTELRAATKGVVGGLEGPRVVDGHKVDEAAFSAGTWEIETASHALWQIWVERKISPRGKNLGDIVLENTKPGKPFAVDFTDADLSHATLSKASLQGAILTGANLIKVTILDGVDLSGITQFDGSHWNDTEWWHVQSISPELCAYLQVNFPPKGTELPSGCRR